MENSATVVDAYRCLDCDYTERRFDPARARFRTFLRVCLDGFVVNEHKAASRIKRGGAVSFVSLDFAAAERELSALPVASGPTDVSSVPRTRTLPCCAVRTPASNASSVLLPLPLGPKRNTRSPASMERFSMSRQGELALGQRKSREATSISALSAMRHFSNQHAVLYARPLQYLIAPILRKA